MCQCQLAYLNGVLQPIPVYTTEMAAAVAAAKYQYAAKKWRLRLSRRNRCRRVCLHLCPLAYQSWHAVVKLFSIYCSAFKPLLTV